jgi:hypothetical protein
LEAVGNYFGSGTEGQINQFDPSPPFLWPLIPALTLAAYLCGLHVERMPGRVSFAFRALRLAVGPGVEAIVLDPLDYGRRIEKFSGRKIVVLLYVEAVAKVVILCDRRQDEICEHERRCTDDN